jgi:hypothetical protein
LCSGWPQNDNSLAHSQKAKLTYAVNSFFGDVPALAAAEIIVVGELVDSSCSRRMFPSELTDTRSLSEQFPHNQKYSIWRGRFSGAHTDL